MKKILLIQHCQSEQHLNGMCGGWTDWPLTELGHKQAENIGKTLKAELKDVTGYRLISSDLTRARQTAEVIGRHLNLTPEFRPSLREINGAPIGKSREWSRAHALPRPDGVSPIDHKAFPETESTREAYARAQAAMEQIVALPCENVIVVSHGYTSGLFTMASLGIGVDLNELTRYSEMRYSLGV